MSRLRYNRRQAVEYLCGRCHHLGRVIGDYGPLTLRVSRGTDLFNALSAAIVYQQLSGKAASTIHGRFSALFTNQVPEAVQATGFSMEQLRAVGLSRNKALAIKDLAEKSLDGTLKPLRSMIRLDDEEGGVGQARRCAKIARHAANQEAGIEARILKHPGQH